MKTCSKCGLELLETAFYKSGNKLRSWCKNCCKDYDKSDSGRARTTKHAKTNKRKISNNRHAKTDKRRLSNAKASAKYAKSNKGKANITKYNKSDVGRAIRARSYAKRKGFGFIGINENRYKNEEWHHLHLENNNSFCISIPNFIHRLISHSSFGDINMDEINALAIQYWIDPYIYTGDDSAVEIIFGELCQSR